MFIACSMGFVQDLVVQAMNVQAMNVRARPEGEAKAECWVCSAWFCSMESEVCCGWLQCMLLVLIMAGRYSGSCM